MMHPNPKQTVLAATALAAALLCPAALAEGRDAAQIKRGAWLVSFGGCADCHTPFKMGANGPEKDMSRGLSGHPEALRLAAPPKLETEWNWAGSASMTAFSGPWGVSYSANLTPDRETGIGQWRERDFIEAMRTGKHLGVTRPIMPPMPWQALSRLPEKDLKAIYAYLMAQPAIKNKVPEYAPPASTSAKAGNKTPS